MEEKSLAENMVDMMIAMVLMTVFMYGLVWSAEREAELGIHGRSSESLLLEKELKDNQINSKKP